MNKFVSIDIGGTAIKYGLIDESGEILKKNQMDTQAYLGGPGIMEKVRSVIKQYQAEDQLSGICISTAGMVDIEKGEIFYAAPLIPDYAGTRFKEVLEQEFSLPCEVENDVNCAGLAESISGAAMGSKVSLCLTIGTGIGGAIVIDQKIFHGAGNSACEVGYMLMDDSDFQTLGAASILSRKVNEKKGASQGEWDGYRIFEAAKQGDGICEEAIDEMVCILGKGIANICYVLNPDVVVLGGGIMAQTEYLEQRLNEALDRFLNKGLRSQTRLAFAQHKNNAGMLGAFYHFRQRQKLKK